MKFVAEGFGVERFDVMYNDFVLVGPGSDPAGVRGSRDIIIALRNLSNARQAFASRGDDSGTHRKERSLWRSAGVDPELASGGWYRETGSGMGATLNVASGMNAYALTDRATWLKFANKGLLQIVYEGDKTLFNQYGVILVNPARHAHVKRDDGQAFIDWLISAEGQDLINRYQIKGQQAFFANAR